MMCSTSMNDTNTSSLPYILHRIRTLDASKINRLFHQLIPPSKIPTDYLQGLSEDDRLTAHHASLLAWFVTGGTQVPREAQLWSCLATFNSKNSLIYARTGSSKTLPIALNLLLKDLAKKLITLTISPLKWLQVMQVRAPSPLSLFFSISIIIPYSKMTSTKNMAYWPLRSMTLCLMTRTIGTYVHIISISSSLIIYSEWYMTSGTTSLELHGTLSQLSSSCSGCLKGIFPS